MASETSSSSPARPLLRRVLSFREPLMLIPCILTFLATAASEFFHIYSSFLHSFARSLIPNPPPATAKLAAFTPYYAAAVEEEEDEEEEVSPHLSREEVEEIMERMGLRLSGNGEGIKARIGHDEVSRMFDADEPSFAEVRRAFAVFDADGDGLIGAADLRAALARLGFVVDAAACRDMIAASCGSVDGTMNLCQFVKFLEKGLC